MTIDEELSVMESHLRRLKIEYEIFFNNPQKKPPPIWNGRCWRCSVSSLMADA